MFLVPLTEFTNSRGDGGEQTDKPPKTRRALFRAARADKEEIKKCYYPKPERDSLCCHARQSTTIQSCRFSSSSSCCDCAAPQEMLHCSAATYSTGAKRATEIVYTRGGDSLCRKSDDVLNILVIFKYNTSKHPSDSPSVHVLKLKLRTFDYKKYLFIHIN